MGALLAVFLLEEEIFKLSFSVGAGCSLAVLFGATPGFHSEVHGIFMALPVVFAAKAAAAVWLSAAVWPCVAFEVFTVGLVVSKLLGRRSGISN